MLKIYLFGESRFILTESPEINPRINLGNFLMAYLIRAKGPVLRQHLASTFWPHLTRADSRTYLRNVLSRLKERYSPWLSISRHYLEFVPNEHCWIDLYELESAIALLNTTSSHNLLTELEIMQLESAFQLYSGKFLGNYSHYKRAPIVNWLNQERQQLAASFSGARVQFTQFYLAKNQLVKGILSAEQVISINPHMTQAWHLLMKAHLKQDNFSQVIKIYKKYADMGLDQNMNNEVYRRMVETFGTYPSNLAIQPHLVQDLSPL